MDAPEALAPGIANDPSRQIERIVRRAALSSTMGSEGRMDFADHYSHLDAEQLKARWLAATFVLYGLIANGLLAISVPPFQVPDEPNHFLRAAQIADGDIIGTRFSVVGKNGMEQLTAGGLSDPAVLESARPFAGIGFHPNTKVAIAIGRQTFIGQKRVP